jgi:YVTN family beta-propeller protein
MKSRLFSLIGFSASALIITHNVSGGYRAYVGNTSGSSVAVIDTATNTVVGSVPTDAGPYAVAADQAGNRAYVANTYADTITVIDTINLTSVATVHVGGNPRGVAVNAAGTRVFVAVTSNSTVAVVDTSDNSVITTIPIPSGPHSLVVSPDGARVYVANNVNYNSNLTVIDTATNSVAGNIPVGSGPVDVALNNDGSRLYVTNNQDFTVSVIDTQAGAIGAVIATLQAGHGVSGVAVNPISGKVYVTRAGYNGEDVLVFDPVTYALTKIIPVGAGPNGLGVTPDGSQLYVGTGSFGYLTVIDCMTETVSTTIPIGGPFYAYALFIGPSPAPQLNDLGGSNLWLGLRNGNEVGSKFDLQAEVFVNNVPAGSGQLNSVPSGGSGFTNAIERLVDLTLPAPVVFQAGDVLSIRLSVRIAAAVPSHPSAIARLWYGDASANSSFDLKIGAVTRRYYLRSGFLLNTTAGTGPRESIDVFINKTPVSNSFKPLGTWSTPI